MPERNHSPLICVAPNGAFKQKTDHAEIPLTIEETAETAAKCYQAGARMIHFHLRDENGRHLLDSHNYQLAIDAIRHKVNGDMLIQVTTESAGIYPPQQQMQCIYELKPDAYSVSIRELFSDKSLFAEAKDFLNWSFAESIRVQFIIYDVADLKFYLSLIDSLEIHAPRLQDNGLPDDGQSLLFVLGRYTEENKSTPDKLIPLLHHKQQHPFVKDLNWMCCAFGPYEFDCLCTAMLLGGDVRVGFENTLLNRHLQKAADNAELVRQAHEFIQQSSLLNPQ